jgi:hypothetical protein
LNIQALKFSSTVHHRVESYLVYLAGSTKVAMLHRIWSTLTEH